MQNYDPLHRNPLFCGADHTTLWELQRVRNKQINKQTNHNKHKGVDSSVKLLFKREQAAVV